MKFFIIPTSYEILLCPHFKHFGQLLEATSDIFAGKKILLRSRDVRAARIFDKKKFLAHLRAPIFRAVAKYVMPVCFAKMTRILRKPLFLNHLKKMIFQKTVSQEAKNY